MPDQPVMIIGGGFVGYILALALNKQSIPLTLIEAQLPQMRAKTEGRAIVLAYTSVLLLKNLNIWTQLEPYATPIETVHVSSQGDLGGLRFNAKDLKLPYLGQVIPAANLGQILQQCVISQNIPIKYDFFENAVSQEHSIAVKLKNTSVDASLLFACDGATSPVRSAFNIAKKVNETGKVAIVLHVYHERPHQHIARQRIFAKGICAQLPLSGNQSTFVLSLEKETADFYHALSDVDLTAHLQKIWSSYLGRLQIQGTRSSYPIESQIAETFAKGPVILLGNAAHTVNPMTAQGLNLALRDIAILFDEIKLFYQQGGKQVTEFTRLYAERVLPFHQSFDKMNERIIQLTNFKAVGPLKGLGLAFANYNPMIKNQWAQALTGLTAHRGTLMYE